MSAEEKKPLLYTLSEDSRVRLGLAVLRASGAWYLATTLANMKTDLQTYIDNKNNSLIEKFQDRFVNKDVFNVQMNELSRRLGNIESKLEK